MLKLIFILTNALVFFSLSASEINVYSYRHYNSDLILHEKFTKLTGIKVNIISAKASQLIEKIEMEEKYTKADVLLTVDIARLLEAKNRVLILFWLLIEKRAVRITPPLTITDKEIEEGCDIILNILDTI